MSIHQKRIAVVFGLAVTMASASQAQERYRIESGKIAVECPLTVGGAFEARTANLSGELTPSPGEPGTVRGSLRVELATLATGIGLRDRHMREEYLEVGKGQGFSVATFDDLRIERLVGKTGFTGTLSLHGQRRPINGTAELQQRDGHIRIQAQFPLHVSDFLIRSPTYLGVGVRDEIQVKVALTAIPAGSALIARTADH